MECPALVTADETMLRLLGGIDLSAKQKIRGVAPGIDLRYGKKISFRVRLADQTGGGPSVSDSPITPAPAPVSSLPFRRWVRPGSPTLISPAPSTFGPAPNFENPPTSLTFQRPRLAYPAVECTGSYSNAVQLLIEDIPAATAAKREPGLFDPDVTAVSITVEVASFPQDPLATDGIYQPIYQTSKSFPSDPAAQLVLSFSWQDFDQISDLVPDNTPNGPLILPTSRNLRVVVAAECKADPNLLYFGADDVRYGPNLYFEIGKHSTSETNLYQAQLPSLAINGFFSQPDTPIDPTLVTAQQASGNPSSVPTDIASLAGNAFGLPNQGLTYYAAPGRRAVFAGAGNLLHTISPDQSSITFSSKNDLALHWIILIRLVLNRDWTWDGLALNGIILSRTDNNTNTPILSFSPSQSISTKIFATNAPTPDRTSTDLLIFDSIDPKPSTGTFPSEVNPSYSITSSFANPSIPPITQSPLTIRLPITTPPSQTPKLLSAGLAFSVYGRSADYSTTSPRQRSLWLEFDSAPLDPDDAYFGRVLFNAPDPLLTLTPAFSPTSQPILEPPLPVPPEPVLTIVPNEASDPAGLNAMQALIPADPDANSPASPIVQYLLPLPPGTTSSSPELFGFYTYEFRVGHRSARWSTAKGRFGPPLRVTGVQHPAPPLVCNTARTKSTITVSAPFASAVLGNVLLNGVLSMTTMWAMVYAQATLIDGSDSVNVLLMKQQMRGPRVLEDMTLAAGTGSRTSTGTTSNTGTSTAGTATTTAPVPATSTTTAPTSATTPTPLGIGVGVSSMAGLTSPTYATTILNTKDVTAALEALGFEDDANISVLAVELLPPAAGISDPLGTDLGKQRILRTSPLVKVPVIC